jgi:hypothetical protein
MRFSLYSCGKERGGGGVILGAHCKSGARVVMGGTEGGAEYY